MRKLFFTVAVTVFTLLSFTSCEEMIVSSDQTIDLVPKATITGNVMAELNMQSIGLENVPAGTQLLVEVNYADFNSESAGKWMDTIQVSADGKYSVQVPTDANGVNVSITPFTFEADQVQNYAETNYQTIKKVFSAAVVVTNIKSGNSQIRNITYTANDQPTFAYKVSLTGKCLANINAETPGSENAPNGTVLVFYTNDWSDSVVVNNGKYSISIPNKTVLCKSKFTRLKKVWNPTLLSYQDVSYKYTINNITFTPSSPSNTFDLNFGEGEDQTIDPAPNTTTLSGNASADSDLTIAGNEPMPDGTKIYFEDAATTWGAIATVSAGKYSVLIPRSATGISTIYYQVNYDGTRKTINSPASNYNFKTTGSTSTTSAITKTLNIIAD